MRSFWKNQGGLFIRNTLYKKDEKLLKFVVLKSMVTNVLKAYNDMAQKKL